MNKKRENVVDVCTILEKCNIETISKYLLNQGKKKKFPDITTRQWIIYEKNKYSYNWTR